MSEKTKRLRTYILRELEALERLKEPEDIALIQPELPGKCQEAHLLLAFAGSEWEEIEAELRWLRRKGLIDSGGVSDPAIGIHFSRVTDIGKRFL
ncbi:hypothetical protein [Pantoea agglomerans]